MLIEHISIAGFRGMPRLSLPLEQGNVLIGENAWGKSSLLDALTLLLAPQGELYSFALHDFHFPPGSQGERLRQLHIQFTFRESEEGEAETSRLKALRSVWQDGSTGYKQLTFRAEGEILDGEKVKTRRQFLTASGEIISEINTESLTRELIKLHPVLRLRDARFNRRLRLEASSEANKQNIAPLVTQVDTLTRELASSPQNLTDEAIRQGLLTMQQLLEHYFAVQPAELSTPQRRTPPAHRQDRQGWRALDSLNRLIAGDDNRSRQLILLRMFALLVQAQGTCQLDPLSRPLLLIEDPETRLHPIMLAVAWGLLSLLPLQKITTTNSSELLSQVPVEDVCRLVREADRVAAWRLGPTGMNAEDSRRIAFHIRFNRPSSLFARCWLLVEGETEVWVMNELARQCGFHFAAEGIKVIEFAQSGLRPLLKFAQRMGIEWHVLTDGDDAGNKYSATTRSQLKDHQQHEQHHLTQLPALDMEHFLYRQGFSDVYHRSARLPPDAPMNARRIITRAIQHSSKPELAIAVAAEAAERGVGSIPPLLRTMFDTVQWLARRRAD
ncbi:ATP-dependent endonuclease [Pantoea sp. BAV 3049]|uniref:ATP-dependent nuclease n=1 Tax=Pantoea sp. BAV 3049 TaxID=2654188 RepID=UPI00131D0ED6|nr:ATP-dependent endonuclease [Pantoea sp. BAV 3049]